jgi:hypothetical protein
MTNRSSGGGQQPPTEPVRSLDEMLDADVRNAIDQAEAIEDDTLASKIIAYLKHFGEQFATALLVSAVIFGLGLWWNNSIEAETMPKEETPEINIGVDPN